MTMNKVFRNPHVYGKKTNLRKVVEKFGAVALNVFIINGTMERFEPFLSLQCAWYHHEQGKCYTLTIEDALKTFPQYFTYE